MFAPDREKRGVQDEFDSKAAEYETNRLAGWYKAHNDIILQHLNPVQGDTVLDIGCGTGYLVRRVLSAVPGTSAIGVDLSAGMINVAERSAADLSPRARFLCDDWEAPGPELRRMLTERKASHAVCASVLHYFSDPVDALRRCRLSLAPGGVLYLLERRREGSLPTIAWDLAHRYLIHDHVRFYSSGELRSMVGTAGFREVEVVRTVRKFLWNNKLSTNLTLIRAVR